MTKISADKRFFVMSILSLLCNVNPLYTADNQRIPKEHASVKKAKIDRAPMNTSTMQDCTCAYCPQAIVMASTLEKRNYIIAQAFLATPLPTDLIDIVYDYAGADLHSPMLLSSNALSILEGNKKDHTISKLRLTTVGMRKMHWGYISPTFLHIVPQEVAFDYVSLKKASEIVCKSSAQQMPTVRSLCQSYCLDFRFKQVIVSSFSPKLSNSQGWVNALLEYNKQKDAIINYSDTSSND